MYWVIDLDKQVSFDLKDKSIQIPFPPAFWHPARRQDVKHHFLEGIHQLLKWSISNQHVFFFTHKTRKTSSQGNGFPDSMGNRKQQENMTQIMGLNDGLW
jgi:hypothetical protein